MTIDITRRRLLQSGAAAGLGALPGMSIIRSAHAAATPTTIVAIHLDGGNWASGGWKLHRRGIYVV